MDSLLTVALTLFLVIDALGTLPSYLSVIEDVKNKQAVGVCLRELFFALILMCLFFYIGGVLLQLLGVSKITVEISGGVVIFLIALRLIFSHEEGPSWKKGKPFIVPIATPLLAGPSFFATITIFNQAEVSNLVVFWGLLIAWFASGLIYLFGRPIFNLIGERGLLACQRLMGLLIALVAVQMVLQGIHDLMQSGV